MKQKLDSIYQPVTVAVNTNKKPLFLGDGNLLQHTMAFFENQKYIKISQKSKNSFCLMYCDENKNVIDHYSVINKGFRSVKAATEYFNKYFINIDLIK